MKIKSLLTSILLMLLLTSCTDKYKSGISELQAERDSLKKEFAKLEISVAVTDQKVKEAQSEISRADSVQKLIVKSYEKRIEQLKQKTPKQIHEDFNREFPTEEEPLVYVSNDQVLAALISKVERYQCIDEMSNVLVKVEGLSKMVSLKDALISDKDSQISLLQKEVTNSEERCSSKIAELESTLRQEKRKARLQKLGLAAIAAALLLL